MSIYTYLANLLDSGLDLPAALRLADKRGYMELEDGVVAPGTGLHARIYIDEADGDLKVKFSDGTVKTIVVDT